MDYHKKRNRINYLNKEFSEVHLNSDECVTPPYKSRVNQNYRERERIKTVDDVLYTLPSYTASLLKEQVYYIVNHYRLKELCGNCKIEVIIACIVIFVWKDYNKRLIFNKNSLWKKYKLSWEIYARIIDNLLRKTREQSLVLNKEEDKYTKYVRNR